MHHGDSNHAPGFGKALQIKHHESYEQASNYAKDEFFRSPVSRISTDCSTFVSIASSSVGTQHLQLLNAAASAAESKLLLADTLLRFLVLLQGLHMEAS